MRGGSADSAMRSLRRGAFPSTLAVPDSGTERRLAANDRAAAKASSADQRRANRCDRCARSAPEHARRPVKLPLSGRGIPAAVNGDTRVAQKQAVSSDFNAPVEVTHQDICVATSAQALARGGRHASATCRSARKLQDGHHMHHVAGGSGIWLW